MSLARLMTRDVVVIRGTATDTRYGGTALTWTSPTRTVTKGWLALVDATENHDGRDALVQVWKLYLPKGTDITGRDRVEVGGVTYELEGPPALIYTPRGENHIECVVKAVEG